MSIYRKLLKVHVVLGVVPVPVTAFLLELECERRKERIQNNDWERGTGTLRQKYRN